MKTYSSVVAVILLCILQSCKNSQSPVSSGEQNSDTETYVSSTADGIVYWHDGKDTVIVRHASLMNPRFSPNKQWIVFSQSVPAPPYGGYIVQIVKTNGDSLQTLAGGILIRGEGTPVWSPDGTKIAFADSNAIHVVTVSKPSAMITYDPNGEMITDGALAWSHDGSRVAFTARYATAPIQIGIYAADTRTNLVDTLIKTSYSNIWDLTWSCDDQNMAFSAYSKSRQTYDYNIIGFNVATRTLYTISDAQEDDLYPSWSPTDNNLLAFSGGAEDTAFPRLLVLYDLSTKTRRALTGASYIACDHPVWSDDGRKIIFEEPYGKFYSLSLQTGAVTSLTVKGYSVDW